MFAAPPSWRVTIEPQRRVVQRVEHRQVALAGHAEGEVGAVQHELVDEDLPAAARHGRHRLLEEDRRALGLGLAPRRRDRRSGSCAARRTPRAAAAPARTPTARRRPSSASTGSGPALEPRLAGPVACARSPSRVDRDRAEEQVADARARVRVAVGDAARLEVDAVAAHEPLGRRRRGRPRRDSSAPSGASVGERPRRARGRRSSSSGDACSGRRRSAPSACSVSESLNGSTGLRR